MEFFTGIISWFSQYTFIFAILRLIIFLLVAWLGLKLVLFILGLIFQLICTILYGIYSIKMFFVDIAEAFCSFETTSNPIDLLLCSGVAAIFYLWMPTAAVFSLGWLSFLQKELFFELCISQYIAIVIMLGWLIYYTVVDDLFSAIATFFCKILRCIVEIIFLPITLIAIFLFDGFDSYDRDSAPSSSSGGGSTPSYPRSAPSYNSTPSSSSPSHSSSPSYSSNDTPSYQPRDVFHGANSDSTNYHDRSQYDGGYMDSSGATHYYEKTTSSSEDSNTFVERDSDGYTPFG